MSFIKTLKAFFRPTNPVAIAMHQAFSVTSDAYSDALGAIEPFSTRAHHRYTLSVRAAIVHSTGTDDACAAYDEAVASYTDPADFKPYTEAYLDAHTAAMETLNAAFDKFAAAFNAYNPADELYTTAADLYKATCETYADAAEAYSNAAFCATISALEAEIQVAKDKVKVRELEWELERAANPHTTDPDSASAKAAAFKSKTAENATKAEVFKQKAEIANGRAEILLAKANSAKIEAEALDTNQ